MMPYKGEIVEDLIKHIEAVTGVSWVTYICQYAKANGMVINEQDLYARYLISNNKQYVFAAWLNKSMAVQNLDYIDKFKNKYRYRHSFSFHENTDRRLEIK